MPKTIVVLCFRRSGSTAVQRVLTRHTEVREGRSHEHGSKTFEQNFWSAAIPFIEGRNDTLVTNVKNAWPSIDLSNLETTQESVFDLWDDIVQRSGGVCVDKSPTYTRDRKTLKLMKAYRDSSPKRQIVFIGLVRDIRDSVTSEYEIHETKTKDNLDRYERNRVASLNNIQWFQDEAGWFPVFKYEDMARAPNIYFPMMLNWCGLPVENNMWNDFTVTSLNRYSYSLQLNIRRWCPGEEAIGFLRFYGYPIKQTSTTNKLIGKVKFLPDSVFRMLPKRWRDHIRSLLGERGKRLAYKFRR